MKIFFIFLIFFLFSCSDSSTTRVVSTQPAKPELNPPGFKPNQTLYWYTNKNVGYSVTLAFNSTDLSYIRGRLINDYLETPDSTTTVPNWKRTYCIVVSYIHAGAKQQLRARAFPIAIGNLKDNTLEKMLRIDWPLKNKNSEVCKGELPTYNILGTKVSTTSDAAFTPLELCPSCSGTVGSSYIALYYENVLSDGKPGTLTESNRVPVEQLDPSVLKNRVDFTETGIFTGKCSQSFCIDQGKDCCIDDQCVDDGTEKNGAIQSPDYFQAIKDVAINPSKYTNYPQIYNICTLPSPAPSTSTPVDSDLEAQAANQRFETQKAEYYCLEEAKKPIPNYTLVCNNKWLCVNEWILTDPTFNGSCQSLDGKTGEQRKDEIKLKVWKLCGCKADPFPTTTDEEDPRCPDFTWKVIRDKNDLIESILCGTNSTDPNIDDLQYPYSVPARAAPHRFYRQDNGKSVDDITTIQKETPEVMPEGLEFLYLDDVNKTDPLNDTFNINAILGQFKVNLSQAVPAKMISVEFDANYVITTTAGSLNPCPLCTKDQWESSFYIWAPSTQGRGLEAIGYTTARNQVNNNLTLGNYEDTGFGRFCYLPPTMIPWSHKPDIDVKSQRRKRLLTQAALYSNGYQKDWFGFNQGALIGSFDGVTWFSVGTIRKVTATSNKLFLAINKPYSDLTDNSAFEVTVGRDVGNTVPDTDFDVELNSIDSRYNRGSSCQKYHVCENDTDCVTQLGWEYTCADITRYKTSWPVFASNADEKPNSQIAQANFTNILQTFNQTGKVKRCVYRGNGAPCKKDYTTNVKDPLTAKLLACAPNFYCASLTETSLNAKVERMPAPNNVYFYGQVTNRLGRPLNYIGGDATFPTEAKENFKNSAIIYSKNGNTDDFGICRPGRLLITTSTPVPNNIVLSHAGKDQKGRTDFISQVASCDSTAVGNNRAITCPFFEESSATATNYGYLGIVSTDSNTQIVQNSQNMCGGESQYLLNGVKTSTFQIIELNRISTLSTIDQPSIVKDACLRRAGAVCHENLDCSPNELHAQQAFSFGQSFFGGTTAEMEFWREDLICGQGQIQPSPTPTASTSTTTPDPYYLNRNRCCRDINLEFTMYTQYQKATTDAPDLIPDNSVDNVGLEVLKYPYKNPSALNRYSRYAITQPLDYTNGHADPPVAQAPILNHAGTKPVTPKEFQWKTFNDTGRKTCCGGGFVRLFSDGTKDWSKRNRLNFAIAGLSCLNYQDTLVFRRPLQVDQQNYNKDYGNLCVSPGVTGEPYPKVTTVVPPLPGLQTNNNEGTNGCSQVPLLQPTSTAITLPWDLSLGTTRITTVPDEKPAGIVVQEKTLSSRAPYIPTPFLNSTPISVDVAGPTYFINQTAAAQSVYLPIYIGGRRNITKVTTSYYTDNTAVATDVAMTEATAAKCQSISQNPELDLAEGEWCIQNSNYTGGYDVFHIRGFEKVNAKDWGYGGFTIYFNSINTKSYDYCTDGLNTVPSTPIVSQSYCTWTGTGGAGANPLAPAAGINAMTFADGCYGSPVYLPNPASFTMGKFYYEVSSTYSVVIDPAGLNISVPTGKRATFESNGTTWQYLGQASIGGASTAPPCPAGSDNDPMKPNDAANSQTIGMGGGNALYYLTKLGRLELLGIPQIFYEPLYCNSNRNDLVPGIFNISPQTREEFEAEGFQYNSATNAQKLYNIYNQDIPDYASDFANPNSYVAMQNLISIPSIFSSSKFICCRNLGSQVETSEQCCSNFSAVDAEGRRLCKLPEGADLHVYLNRFVSGDGVGDFQPGGGFTDKDFIPETGEPNLTKEVSDKIRTFGEAYCSSGNVRFGGAFGYFIAQPNMGYFTQTANPDSNSYYSIIDSALDYQGDPGDTLTGAGTVRYLEGYRWNHHLYCAP